MSLVEDIREVEVFEKEESRHTQVSSVGVIEDVPVKIVLGAGAHWPCSSSHSLCLHLYQDSLIYMCLLQTRSLVANRCVTWMQQWAIQPPVMSVRGDHKGGIVSESRSGSGSNSS